MEDISIRSTTDILLDERDDLRNEIARLREEVARLQRDNDQMLFDTSRDAYAAELAQVRSDREREANEFREQIARLEGDRCEVCDEHGLIYVTAWDHANGCESEEAAMCPACGGTRSGYASEVTKERDAALAERDALAVRVEELKAAEAVVACEAIDAYQAGTPAAAPRTVTPDANFINDCAHRLLTATGWDEIERELRDILADLGLQVEGVQGKETPSE